jgi:serine/threonine protein kinase
MESLAGEVLGGRYRILRKIGSGGMGIVYEAEQLGLGRRVAVKVLHPSLAHDRESVGRMAREARAAAALGHPHIVEVTDFQTPEGGTPFLVMALLKGESLRALLDRERRLEPQRIARIALQLLAALDAAHAAGLIHRDVKPENVFLEKTSAAPDFVRLLDFGIAKPLARASATTEPLSRSGVVLGTPEYMAPEQARGEDVDARADLYSVGVVMYEALAGPGTHDEAMTANAPRASAARLPLRSRRPDVDPALADMVHRALEEDRALRFPSAALMAAALESWMSAQAPRPLPSYVPARSAAPAARPATFKTIALFVLFLAFGATMLGVGWLILRGETGVSSGMTGRTVRPHEAGPHVDLRAPPKTTSEADEGKVTQRPQPSSNPNRAKQEVPRPQADAGGSATSSAQVILTPHANPLLDRVPDDLKPKLRAALWGAAHPILRRCYEAPDLEQSGGDHWISGSVTNDGALTGVVVHAPGQFAYCIQSGMKGARVQSGYCPDATSCSFIFHYDVAWR